MAAEETLATLVARIDERTTEMKNAIEALHRRLDAFVTKDTYQPVQRVVYGLVALILTAVFAGLIAMVMKQ